MAKILVMNGPNLNLLGTREPEHYGTTTLAMLEQGLKASTSHQLIFFQSNAEHELIERLHQTLKEDFAIMMLNPAAYTHTSIALRDAVTMVKLPFIEIHISNIFKRESFRHHSYFTDLAEGLVSGLGIDGYFVALQACERWLIKRGIHGHTQD